MIRATRWEQPVASTAPTVNDDAPPPPPADVNIPLPTLPEGDTLAVDAQSSKILFKGAKISGSHDGGFEAFSGRVVLQDDIVVGTSFTIQMDSTTSDHPKLTKHLKSKNFFHVEKYAVAEFVSAEVNPAPNPGAVTHKVNGVLDFHGKQRPLSFPASITVGETETTVTALSISIGKTGGSLTQASRMISSRTMSRYSST